MFSIIRIIIGLISLVSFIVVIRKHKVTYKRMLYVISTVAALLLTTILSFLPFENLFITFGSPEEAYEYYSFRNSDIEKVIEGHNSDFVIDRKKGTIAYLIIPKNENGWKVGVGTETKTIAEKFSDGVLVTDYRYKDSGDYLLSIISTEGEDLTVTDNFNTEFYALKRTDNYIEGTFVAYYAYVPYFDSQYSVTVNGKIIELGK